MRNAGMTAVKSQAIGRGNRKTMPIYYSIMEDAIYTTPGTGRYKVTELIRPNTEEEIKQAVNRWLAM